MRRRTAKASRDSVVSVDADELRARVSTIARRGVQGSTLAAAVLLFPEGAHAVSHLNAEPANALSIPTWAIHISSLIEWLIAMGLVWTYGDVTGRPVWKGLTWGMVRFL